MNNEQLKGIKLIQKHIENIGAKPVHPIDYDLLELIQENKQQKLELDKKAVEQINKEVVTQVKKEIKDIFK